MSSHVAPRRRSSEHRAGRVLAVGVVTALSLSFGGVAGVQAHEARDNHNAVASQTAPEPPTLPTPKARCGPGDRPETGLQGRVSPADHASGRASRGFTCNTRLIGEYRVPNAIGTVGGFKVERYTDRSGHDCAYYDTTLMWPTNILDREGGVNVMDMSDPRNPRLTARLLTPAMLSPHESVVVSHSRGLVLAVSGNLSTREGQIDIYDISQDCRNPVLRSSTLSGILGHESGIAPDGRTFYAASPAAEKLTAVDITNPSLPIPIWQGDYDSHGLSIRDDGNRAYVAGTGSGLIILDTSEVQQRVFNPTVREVARLRWSTMSIPQNAIPVTIKGRPYVMEIDEFSSNVGSTGGQPGGRRVGAARMIDISDERQPRVISNMRLEVHQPEHQGTISSDNGYSNPVQSYTGHYCNVPTRVDPEIVACSFILSGLRVFDIRDPYNPREIAYFNAPVDPRIVPPAGVSPPPSNWAMSSPSFVPERNEIWYSDGLSGFYAVRLTDSVAALAGQGRKSTCLARRSPIGPRNIGRVRLGYTRRRLQRIPVRIARKTRRSYRFCVKRSKGRVSAVFSGRGRVVLATTTARAHGNRRLHPGSSLRALRRAYPRRKRFGRGVFRANRKSPRLIVVRKGRVRAVAVANRRLLRNRRSLRRYLKLAGL